MRSPRRLAAHYKKPSDAHIAACMGDGELEGFGAVIDYFAAWPADVLRPASSVQARLARQVFGDASKAFARPRSWSEPPWQQVASGIACKLLATDAERHRVSMLVRLEPGARYPAHRHAGVEELHLLTGELWIDGRKLIAGDYNVGRPEEADTVVSSETGCTCLLVTSTNDSLGT